MADCFSANEVILAGRMGLKGELKQGKEPHRIKFLRFSLATTEIFKGHKKITTWHNITVWRGMAEWVDQYVNVGDLVYLRGKLKYRFYQDEDGNKRKVIEIPVENMTVLYKAAKNREDEEPDSGFDEGPGEDSEDDEDEQF